MKIPTAKKRPWSNQSQQKIKGNYNRSRDPFYHTNKWRKLSEGYLKNNPLCAECRRNGIIRASEVTDHIIPKPICKDPYDRNNLQPLCKECHKKKSAKDKKAINGKH